MDEDLDLVCDEDLLFAFIEGNKEAERDLRDTIDLFQRSKQLPPGLKLNPQLTFVFMQWLDEQVVNGNGGPLKIALDYGMKLYQRTKMKEIERKKAQL